MSSVRLPWFRLLGIFAVFVVVGPPIGLAVLAAPAGATAAALAATSPIFLFGAYVAGGPAAMLAGLAAVALARRGAWWIYLIGCTLAGAVAAPFWLIVLGHDRPVVPHLVQQSATIGAAAALACAVLTLGVAGLKIRLSDVPIPTFARRLRADQVLLIGLGLTMAWMVFGLLAPALRPGGHRPAGAPCSVAETIRLEVQGRVFRIPADLKPYVFGAPEGTRLPSFKNADPGGGWAYCQRPDEPPTKLDSLSFFPRHPGMPEIAFLIIGREGELNRPRGSAFPMRMESGFEVTRSKGPVYVFSPAGGIRPTPVSAFCSQDAGGGLGRCRIDFVTRRGTNVTFDLTDGDDYPFARWGGIISNVDDYVASFEP